MLQQTRDSKCHCCLIVKYSSQLHKQFISPIPLVQFNWYCERGGDNEDALTLGRDLINLLFSQRCLQTFFIFLVILFALCTSWRKVINLVALCNNNCPSHFVLNLAVAKKIELKRSSISIKSPRFLFLEQTKPNSQLKLLRLVSFRDHCAWASSHVHYCHRVTFPKVTSKKHQNILRSQSAYLVFRKWVSNNRVYFGVNQHTKITISVSESFVDGPRWQTKCSAASWSALIATSAWPNEKAMKYIISQEAYLHFSYSKTTIFV